MTAEYSCIYGISKPVKHLRQGVFYRTYGEDLSFLTTLGKNMEVFWFVFQKLDRKYTVPNIPRFTKRDAEAQAQKLSSQPITDQVVFQDIWEQRESYLLAPLEEALYSDWTWERFACIGDSAHKVSHHYDEKSATCFPLTAEPVDSKRWTRRQQRNRRRCRSSKLTSQAHKRQQGSKSTLLRQNSRIPGSIPIPPLRKSRSNLQDLVQSHQNRSPQKQLGKTHGVLYPP